MIAPDACNEREESTAGGQAGSAPARVASMGWSDGGGPASEGAPAAGEDPQGLYDRGLRHRAEGRLDEAVRDFTDWLSVDPAHQAARRTRAEALARLGNHKQALADFTRAVGLNPLCAASYLGRGDVYQ